MPECGEALKKAKRKQTPGVMHRLSTSCREKTREIARTKCTLNLYDNINYAEDVAEQTLGKKSEFPGSVRRG